MSHENAPATQLVATRCCACRTPLVDANSVELGIGPICRRKTAKEDVGQPADWDRVCDLLAEFGARNQSDDHRREVFELCLRNLDVSERAVGAQKAANVITHYIAIDQHRADKDIGTMIEALRAMGRPALAGKIADNLYTIKIVADGATLLVTAPYSETLRNLMWQGRIGRWDHDAKAYRVASDGTTRLDLLAALRRAYPGTLGMGPKGEFRL